MRKVQVPQQGILTYYVARNIKTGTAFIPMYIDVRFDGSFSTNEVKNVPLAIMQYLGEAIENKRPAFAMCRL